VSESRVRESAPRRARNLLVRVQPGELPVHPGSEGRGAGERSPVSKPPDKGSVGADANLQAATRVNPHVASSHRTPPRGGHRERRAAFLPAKAATGYPPATGVSAAPGSPAYQGWHAGKVAGGNSGDPYSSRPDLRPGNPAYKAETEVARDGGRGVGGERTSVDGQDNTTCPEQRLPASAALVGAGKGRRQSPKGVSGVV
jgi:hypothetical protein